MSRTPGRIRGRNGGGAARCRIALVGLAACAAIVSASEASADTQGVAARWTPTLSVGFDVQNQSVDAETETEGMLGVGGSASTTVLSSLFRFDGALYSPSLFASGGAPRLFVHAGAQIPLSSEQAILRANEEFLVPPSFPPPPPDHPTNLNCPTTEQIPGTDSPGNFDSCDHVASMDLIYDVNWYAGLGVEFTLPVSQRQFKIRPSVDYFGQSLGFRGIARRDDRGGDSAEILRTISISSSASEIAHAVGPRLTFDIEAARVGAFSLNVFLETQFYWILSNRNIALSGTSDSASADFRISLDPLIAQGGGGLRIVWHGD